MKLTVSEFLTGTGVAIEALEGGKSAGYVSRLFNSRFLLVALNLRIEKSGDAFQGTPA